MLHQRSPEGGLELLCALYQYIVTAELHLWPSDGRCVLLPRHGPASLEEQPKASSLVSPAGWDLSWGKLMESFPLLRLGLGWITSQCNKEPLFHQ